MLVRPASVAFGSADSSLNSAFYISNSEPAWFYSLSGIFYVQHNGYDQSIIFIYFNLPTFMLSIFSSPIIFPKASHITDS